MMNKMNTNEYISVANVSKCYAGLFGNDIAEFVYWLNDPSYLVFLHFSNKPIMHISSFMLQKLRI